MAEAEQKTKNKTGNDRYHVPNLNRALMILEFLATEPHGCGISEIARRLDLSKNSVFRIVSTLHAHDYLHRDPSGKQFSLGPKLLALGYAAIDEHHLVEKSLDQMCLLRDETEETVLFGTLVDDEGMVLEQVPSNQPVKFLINVGHRFPLHSAAPAKAMIAFFPTEEQETLMDRMKFTRFNERTITDKESFRAELAGVRELGYAVDNAEEVEGLHCVAAPVFNHRGRPLAAVWVTGPSFRLRHEDFERVGKIVKERARIISARFGHSAL